MTPFELEWLKDEKEQHSRLLYQLKRELVDARRSAPAISPGLPRPNEVSRPSNTERPAVRTPIPVRQVMYR